MVIATICLLLPLLVGLIALQFQEKNRVPQTLLLHHITPNGKRPKSLSEISQKLLNELCVQAQRASLSLTTLSASKTNSNSRALTFDDGFSSIYSEALPILTQYNFKATLYITTGHLQNLKTNDVYSHEKLNRRQITELYQAGFEIGSHTVTHRALTLLSDKDICFELTESKKILEEITENPIELLAFPLGLWNERVLSLAKECGYTKFTAYNYHNKIKNRNEISPVTAIYPFDSANDIKQKLLGTSRKDQAFCRSKIIPHFAKGSPLASFSKAYNPLRFFDAFDTVEKK